MNEFESGELRAAITQGLKKDETPYIQELGQLLTADDGDTMRAGIGFEGGNNPDVVQRVSDLLGIEHALQQESLELVSVSIADATSNSIKGSLAPFIKEIGVVPALSLIQASRWDVYSAYARLWSSIAVGNTTEDPTDSTNKLVDTTRPVIAFSALGVYTTTQRKKLTTLSKEVLPTYGKEDATRFTRDDEARFPAIALKRYLDATHVDVSIPIKAYGVQVGRASFGMGSIGVSASHTYRLRNDHLVRRKEY